MSVQEEAVQPQNSSPLEQSKFPPQDVERLLWILLEGHATRVAEATVTFARMMGTPEEELTHIRRGALLHDIGKLQLPEEIIYKTGPLSEHEWRIMRRHPMYAVDLLRAIPELQAAVPIPYCHHEKWDGSGYPRGLKGQDIPQEARIFSVVDVWDALTSDRIYRAAWPEQQVLDYIQERSGADFDPEVVDLFVSEYMNVPVLNEMSTPPPKPLRRAGF